MSQYTNTMLKLERMTQATNAQQMNWQEKMSKTSHQMEVSDLVAAGLNPVLSSGGSGAQSYTTSLDSGASAIANTYSAKESASATRYAARQSAAATRAAAYAQLEAARLGKEASNYAADKHFEATKYQTDHSKTGNAWGVLSSIFQKGIEDPHIRSIAEQAKKSTDKARTNAKLYLNDPNKKFSWKNMNSKGIKQVNSYMKQFGIKRTAKNQDLFIDAFYNRNKNSMTKLVALLRANNKNKSSASAYGRYMNY